MSKLSIKSKVSEQLHNFANETSIHGICFVAQPEQPKFKRAIWFVLVSVSLVYAAYQITSVLRLVLHKHSAPFIVNSDTVV